MHVIIKYIHKKNLVWHSHNFLLLCITKEENFIIRTTFIFTYSFNENLNLKKKFTRTGNNSIKLEI